MRYLICLFLFSISLNTQAQHNAVNERMAKATLYEFIQAMAADNYDNTKKLCTKNSHEFLTDLEIDYKKQGDKASKRISKRKKDLLESTIDYKSFVFEEATCILEFSLSFKPEKVEVAVLKKVGELWLLDLVATEEKDRERNKDEMNNAEEVIDETAPLSEDEKSLLTMEVKDIVTRFIKATVNDDYDVAKSLSTQETNKIIEVQKLMVSMIPDSLIAEVKKSKEDIGKATLTFKEVSFEGDQCKVTFATSIDKNNSETIWLKREASRQWLIALEHDMPAIENPEQEAVENAKETDSDIWKDAFKDQGAVYDLEELKNEE